MKSQSYGIVTTTCPKCNKETSATGNGSHVIGNCDSCGHYFGGFSADEADKLRRRLPWVPRPDMCVMTPGVRMLEQPDLYAVLRLVRAFEDFKPENDPGRVHDFGKVRHAGVDYFFKIDDYRGTDPEQIIDGVPLRLVLTIMRADEY